MCELNKRDHCADHHAAEQSESEHADESCDRDYKFLTIAQPKLF